MYRLFFHSSLLPIIDECGGMQVNMAEKLDKASRLLRMHERLSTGESIIKNIATAKFGIPPKTFQRDIDSLRLYYAEQGGGELVYDRKANCYRLDAPPPDKLTKQEVFAVCKVLIESRAFNKAEFDAIIDKILRQCEPAESKAVKSLIANEQVNYLPLRHGKPLAALLWELAECVKGQNIIKFCYKRLDGTIRSHEAKPVGIMFSEFYFYLIGFMADDSKKFPTVFRVDRIEGLARTNARFNVPYAARFSEAEFRKRVQFMYPGELRTVRFLYKGNLEAALDRLPTARVEKQSADGAILRAEAYGDGIDMWLRSQGEKVEVLS
jgi:predicted DNA-binding transcriptional regulator YafY